MSTTASGIPRVKQARVHKARPIEVVGKRPDPKKKVKEKEELDNQDDTINGWRKKK